MVNIKKNLKSFLLSKWTIPLLLIAILIAVIINIAITADMLQDQEGMHEKEHNSNYNLEEKEDHHWWFFGYDEVDDERPGAEESGLEYNNINQTEIVK